jgi:signal transduction histidine kinase/ActR/RegA family two-component response regulator
MRSVPFPRRRRPNEPSLVVAPVLELAARLVAEGPPAEVLRGAVELLPGLLHVDRVALLRHDPFTGLYRLIADTGAAPASELAAHPLTDAEVEELTVTLDTLGFMLVERRPPLHPSLQRLLDGLGLDTAGALVLPLRYGGTRVGLLLAGLASARELTAAELGLARGVADQLSLAIATSRLREENARRTRELAALHSAALATGGALELDAALRSICDQAARAFDADGAAILLLNEERTHLVGAHIGGEGRTAVEIARWQRVRIPVHPSLLEGAEWEAHRTEVVPDVAEAATPRLRLAHQLGVRSLIIVRLRVGGRPGGMLLIGDRRPGVYSSADVPLAEALAEHASAAIDRARAYEELERSTRRVLAQKTELEGILTHLSDGLMLADTSRRVIMVNPAARTILNMPPDAADPLPEAAYWRGATAGGVPLGPDDLPLARALAGERGAARDLEITVDGEPRIISVSATALTTPEGELHGAVAILRDVTEVRRGQDRAAETERLRALGEMASGVAHDFNNLLGVILGRCELLLAAANPVSLPQAARPHLEVVRQAALDGAETVKRLQAFSGVSHGKQDEAVDLGRIVHDVVEFSRPRWKDAAQQRGITIAIETEVEPLPLMQGNAAELREVLLNLVINAVDALPQGGTIRIIVRRAGGEVHLVVQDTGVGMSEAVRRRIFEPFFTTKGSSGAGLGLSMSYGIISRMGGRIDVSSAPCQGTTFTITLPFRPAQTPSPRETASAARSLRVLVVDDEPQMLSTTTLMLEMDGHRAVTAARAAEALALLRDPDHEPFDVVLTDLGMPEMNGFQFVAALRAAGLDTPCILVTGWGHEVSDGELRRSGAQAVLPKPFSATQLRDVLAAVTARHALPAA